MDGDPSSTATDPLAAERKILHEHFGHQHFRPLQGVVVRAVTAGKDVLAVLPTGGGKSICYQIPAVLRGGLTVVVSPLIALMQDQVDAALRRGIRAAQVNSSLSAEAQREVLRRVLQRAVDLLYVAPERLTRLAEELKAIQRFPTLLAVDEAHCISEWGHDFRPSYRALGRARWRLGWPQTIAATGSATREVRADIVEVLGLGRRVGRGARCYPSVVHVGSFDRPNLRFRAEVVRDDRDRLRRLLTRLREDQGSAIVYTPTRNLSEALSRILWHHGVRALPYHAGMTTERRSQVLIGFLEEDIQVVVATSAFGMGIDAPRVRLVAHWSPPSTLEAYYQEAGRAGRDGEVSECILFHRRADTRVSKRLLQATFPPEDLVERAWGDPSVASKLPRTVQDSVERLRVELKPASGPVDWRRVRRRKRLAFKRLRAVERYARATRCRRRVLLEWFGERVVKCGGCDRCGNC